MALYVLTDCKLWLGEYDFSGDHNALALNYSSELEDVTTFGDDTRTRIGGLKTVAAELEGFVSVSDGANDQDDVMFANVGISDKLMTIGPEAGVDGEIAYFFLSNEANYTPGAAVGEAMRFTVSAEASEGAGGLVRGTIMHNATRTATGNGTGRQLGAVSSTQKLYAGIHVPTASDGDTLDVTIESDATNSFSGSETIRGTFTQISAITSEWLTPIAGAITDTWWRVRYVIAGVSPSYEFITTIGIK